MFEILLEGIKTSDAPPKLDSETAGRLMVPPSSA